MSSELARWVARYSKHLDAYFEMKNQHAQLGFLSAAGMPLLEGVAHVEGWLLTRHVHAIANGTAKAKQLQEEAYSFFLLGAAADSAGNHYAQSGEEDIEASAKEGVLRLFEALNAEGDPMNLRSTFAQKVQWWIGVVKDRGDARPGSVHQRTKMAKKSKSDPARDPLLRKHYEVLHPIAAGAFSTILKCRHIEAGVELAIKSFDAATCAKDANVGDARDRGAPAVGSSDPQAWCGVSGLQCAVSSLPRPTARGVRCMCLAHTLGARLARALERRARRA